MFGPPRHRHFVGFFNVPVPASTRQPFYGYSEKPPHFSRLLRRMGIRRTYSRRKHPRVATWVATGENRERKEQINFNLQKPDMNSQHKFIR